ncbi:vascular cell adhesion protein 1b [Esox lucius]|uniref:Ig-like domain-containing protein n=1 Tax=Esox lucius TaxID=8010 RepID=A0A3P8ZFA2_ESOLU|nr:vascular cell adhesion protein 1b [Esox lucius]
MSLLWLLMLPAAAFAFNVEIHPKSALFRAGDTQELRCMATDCNNQVTISWNSLEDKPMFAQIHTDGPESVAVFDPVTKDNEAALLCRVDCGGVFKRQRAVVKVYSFPEAPVVSGHDRLISGEVNILTCQVTNFYPLEYLLIEWRRGDHVLQTASESTLSTYAFTPTRDDVNGSISCRATHGMDGVPDAEKTKETTVPLTVLYVPQIISISQPTTVRVGTGLTLWCLAEGYPRPEIRWKAVGPGGQFVIVGQSEELALKDVNMMHSGLYGCVASNSVGNATASVKVTVLANTTISVSPRSKVKEGDSVTVSCQSDIAPVGRMVLKRLSNGQGVELQSSDGSSTSFAISSALANDSAVYECEASNEYGSQKVRTLLSVEVYPLEVKMDPAVTVEVGSILVLSCQALGCPQPAFSWKSVLPVDCNVLTQDSLSQLHLAPVGLANEQTYTCEAKCGSVVKAKHIEVRVFSFPSDPVILNPGPFLEDRVANLYCSIADVYPSRHLRVQWLDGDKELPSDAVKNSSGLLNWTSQLSLMVGPEHQGRRIACRVSLQTDGVPLGRRERQALTELEIHYAPRGTTISVSPANEVKEGDSVTVSCQSDGAPVGRMVLRRISNGQGVELQSSDGSSTSFSLSSARLVDSGVYVCEASNEYGHHGARTHFTVRAPPRNITVQVYPSSEVQEGHNVTVSCHSNSFPAPAVVLRKLDNGMELYSLDGNFLLLNVTLQDAGRYLVNVTNDLGYETEIFSIVVMKKHSRSSPDLNQIVIPAVCLGIMLTTSGLVLDYLRRARRKGFYELTKVNLRP